MKVTAYSAPSTRLASSTEHLTVLNKKSRSDGCYAGVNVYVLILDSLCPVPLSQLPKRNAFDNRPESMEHGTFKSQQNSVSRHFNILILILGRLDANGGRFRGASDHTFSGGERFCV